MRSKCIATLMFGFCFLLAACPEDPPLGPECGNGTCEDGEDPGTCPADCMPLPPPPMIDAAPPPPECDNDGQCEPGEDDEGCFADCHCGNGACDGNETNGTCENDCEPVCGDDICRDSEDLECPECHADLALRNQSEWIVYYWFIKRCTDSEYDLDENWVATNPLDFYNERKELIVRIGCWDMVAFGWDGYPAWVQDALTVKAGDDWTWTVYTPNKPDQPGSALSSTSETASSTSASSGRRLTR